MLHARRVYHETQKGMDGTYSCRILLSVVWG